MKILEVTPFFKPSWESGGVARVAYEVSKQLLDRGHEVTVYTTNRARYPTDVVINAATDIDGIEVYYFENLRKYFPKLSFAFLIPYYLPIIARKEVKKFDIIHIHDHRSLLAIIVSHYAKKYNIPYVLQAHGSLPYTVGNKKMKILFDVICGKKMLRGASRLIALNRTEAECYRSLGVGADKIEIVPNGIDLSEYLTIPDSGVFRKKYRILENQKIVLYVGRLDPTKGIDLLIQSFSDLLLEDKNARLVLVGGDIGYGSTLKNRVRSLNLEDQVIFTGFVSQQEKMAAIVDADVFVTPSFTGFPMTFMEACLCGTPIVTTDKGDALDWIDERVGYVVEYDRVELKDAMLKILSDDRLRQEFAEWGQKIVLKHYNWSAIVKNIEELYYNAHFKLGSC